MKRIKHFQMTLLTYYTFTWWAVLFLAFTLTAISGAMNFPLALLGIFTCGWTVAPRFLGGLRIPKITWPYLLIISSIFWTVGIFALIHEVKPIQFVVAFFSGLLPIFLNRNNKVFGVWIAFMTVALLAVISVILWSSVAEYTLFLAFLICLLLNLNAANLVETAGFNASQFLPLPPKHLRQFAPAIGWGFVLAACVFLFFPRKPALHNPFGIRDKGSNIGYTGSVSLQLKSELKATARVAMMVESPDNNEWLQKDGPGLYFRGNVLDKFDGKDWSLSNPGTAEFNPSVDLRHTTHYELRTKRLRIYREPHLTRAVVYPWVLMQVQAPWRLIGGLSYDRNGNLTRGHSETIRYAYEVVVSQPLRTGEIKLAPLASVRKAFSDPKLVHPLMTMPAAGSELAPYLQIPYRLDENNFFTRWVKEVGGNPNSMSVEGAIENLRKHFSDKFTPSMSSSMSTKNPLESFLTKDRKGHCEYFATAAVLYLRALGIPTRLALGYRGGSFNSVSKALEVHDHDAHSWAEFYFPVLGWVPFDPTPTIPGEKMSMLEATLSLYVGAAKFFANRYLVDYNDITQRNLVKTLATAKTYGLASWKTPDFVQPSNGFILAILSIAFWFGRRWLRRRKLRRTLLLPDYYRAFENTLLSQKIERAPAETFAAFHERLMAGGWDADIIRQFASALERELYACRKVSEDERRSLMLLSTRLSRSA